MSIVVTGSSGTRSTQGGTGSSRVSGGSSSNSIDAEIGLPAPPVAATGYGIGPYGRGPYGLGNAGISIRVTASSDDRSTSGSSSKEP